MSSAGSFLKSARDWLFEPPQPAVGDGRVVSVRLVADASKPKGRWDRAVSAAFAWIWFALKNLTLIAGVCALVLFVSPGLYRASVRWLLPTAYYKLGALGDPRHDFTDLPSWNVDLSPIDDAERSTRLAQFFTDRPFIARLGVEKYLIGRGDPKDAGDESAGRTWQGGQCLFVKDFEFRVVHRVARYKLNADGQVEMAKIGDVAFVDRDGRLSCDDPASAKAPPKTPLEGSIQAARASAAGALPVCKGQKADLGSRPRLEYDSTPLDTYLKTTHGAASGYFTMKSSEILAQSGLHGAAAARWYMDRLMPALARSGEVTAVTTAGRTAYSCQIGDRGASCPRIEIWARGAVASCSINPLGH